MEQPNFVNSGQEMIERLELYDLPFPQKGYTFEAKLLYLAFIGVNEQLMHSILD